MGLTCMATAYRFGDSGFFFRASEPTVHYRRTAWPASTTAPAQAGTSFMKL